MGEVQAVARTLDLKIVPLPIRRAEDIALAFEALKDRADALYVCSDPLVNTTRIRINTLVLDDRFHETGSNGTGRLSRGFLVCA